MPLAISIQDNATPWLNFLARHLAEPVLQDKIGGEVTRLLLDHLTALDIARPNALGGRRTHFYESAGKNTSYATHDNGVTISVNQTGIAQRYFGGTIEPGPGKKYLTIPARAEAHGRRAGEFDNLEFLFGRHGPYALAERQATAIKFRKRKGETTVAASEERGSGIFYWLVKSVSQDPDSSVLPSESAILNSALFAARRYAQTLTPNAQHTSD